MPAADLDLLLDAARAAGDIATRHFKGPGRVWDKPGGAGPVTEADLEVDTMLRESLLAARPGYGWLSEETEDDAARLALHRTFIVDPIDGTRSFIDGSATWAHSLAVAEAGQITAAVVYLPLRDKLYIAGRGTGATLNGQPIRASARNALDGAKLLAARPTLDMRNWPGGVPDVQRHFRASLAYRLCLVAEGRFDAMLTLRDTWEWDIAAGSLIATEAGAVVCDRSGAPIRFNTPRAQSRGALVAAGGLKPAFLSRLTSVDQSSVT